MWRIQAVFCVSLFFVGCGGDGNAQTGGGGSGATTKTDNTSTSITTESETTQSSTTETSSPKELVLFYRTEGFVHGSIPTALSALTDRAKAEGWNVSQTDDNTFFTAENLKNIAVIAFVMTSGDVFDQPEEDVFQQFIENGGGFVGIHSATDTEYDFPFYGELVGAYFESHPATQKATMRVERPGHFATHHLPKDALWSKTDEWYSFKENPRQKVNVLLSLDEDSYAPGASAKGDHPIAWYKGQGAGRSFYTALGHTDESWQDPMFMDHVWGGIEWASGRDWENVVLAEFDGANEVGTWSRLAPPVMFPFTVDKNEMVMTDVSNLNQHVLREGITIDPARPYVMEALFRIAPGTDSLNSFCFDLNLNAEEVLNNHIYTWATNVDLGAALGTGTMKHMGFVNGGFAQIGETLITWGEKDTEYLLRSAVNINDVGVLETGKVTSTVLRDGIEVERHTVNYSPFPYQPDLTKSAQIGVNTHGTDWTMRSLRIYYEDGPAQK